MKQLLFSTITLLFLSACSGPKDYITDDRDGMVYHLDAYGDQTWIREDIVFQTPAEENTEAMPEGLYTREQAKAACPEGFHLPTLAEWQKRIMTYPGSGNPRNGRFVHLDHKDSSLYYRGLVWSGRFMAENVMAVYWTTTDSTRVFNDESGIAEPAYMGVHVYNDDVATDSVSVEPTFSNSPDHGFSCKCIKDS